jgi:hypothetical protein
MPVLHARSGAPLQRPCNLTYARALTFGLGARDPAAR